MRFLLPSWKGVGSAVLAVLGLALCAAERGTCLRRTPIDARPPSSCGLARGFLGKNSTAEGRLSRKAFFAVRGGESVQARVASAIPSAAFLGRSPRVPLEAAALGAGRLSSFSEESPAASPCKSRKMSGTPLAWRFAAASRGARSLRPCAVSCRLGGGGCFVPFAETQRRRLFSLGVGRSGEEGSRDRLSAAFSRTKQVATIGPASWDFEQIEQMFLNGVDVFRLNMSHGVFSEKHQQLLHVREVERKYNSPIAVLADLPGPKLRLGVFEPDEVILKTGQRFVLDANLDAPGNEQRAALSHPELIAALRPGHAVLLDDGKLELRVERILPSGVECSVVVGGPLSSKKGANFPSAALPISAVTDRDREIAQMVVEWGVDFLALSFVQSAGDVFELRRLVQGRVPVVAKIEKPQALERLEEIAEAADALMVARGDLGLELPPEQVPAAQRRIVAECRRRGKPVVVATQMLESMISAPRPTRAEVSDVASAVLQGADAVMLSGETAASPFSARNVEVQRRVLRSTEEAADAEEAWRRSSAQKEAPPSQPSALAAAAGELARRVNARAVAAQAADPSGLELVEALSALRLKAPVLAVTDDVRQARRLQLFWGVQPLLRSRAEAGGLSWEQTAQRAAQEFQGPSERAQEVGRGGGVLVVAETGNENLGAVKMLPLDENAAGKP